MILLKYLRCLLLLLLVNVSAFADNENNGNRANGAYRVLGDVQNLYSNRSVLINKNGSSISALRRDYEFIFFYSADCQYCKKFNPVLKLYSDGSGISVKAFVIGGGTSPYFTNSTVVTQKVIDQFFGKGSRVSVPTLFILNKSNLHVYPVSSGALTYLELSTRMNELVPKILQHERNYERGNNA